MTEYALSYGKTHISFHLPESIHVDTLMPKPQQPIEDVDQAIREALQTPLSRLRLDDFRNVGSVGIAINDKTRPIPTPDPLPILLDHLQILGIPNQAITLFVSSGTHSPMTQEELSQLLSVETIDRYRIVVHDCDRSPMAHLGKTGCGTPILINQDFFDCDLKLTIGNIEPHHFMGFSGGVKTAAIGLAGRETITANHAMLVHEQAQSGFFYINPMRQDIEEIGKKAGIHLSLGMVLDENKHILQVFFGDPPAVMKAAIPLIRKVFGVSVPEPYDLVIASPGGAPKDINLYQAQKGLTHASRITKDNGCVLLLAACPEGSGSQSYEEYVKNAESHQSVLDEFKSGFFEVGPHKAYQIAREAVRINVILISDIPPDDVQELKLTPSKPELLDQLLEWLMDQLPMEARIALLPAATRTMTEVKNG